ncbi:hypothetical protein L1887_48868 [Cichorium endivia]|nr:hypothetical protein L1887_48868 [Cichorium endivia]
MRRSSRAGPQPPRPTVSATSSDPHHSRRPPTSAEEARTLVVVDRPTPPPPPPRAMAWQTTGVQRRRKSLFSKKARSELPSERELDERAAWGAERFIDPFAQRGFQQDQDSLDLSCGNGRIAERSSQRFSTQRQEQQKRAALERVSDLVCLAVENQMAMSNQPTAPSSPEFQSPSSTLFDTLSYQDASTSWPTIADTPAEASATGGTLPMQSSAQRMARITSSEGLDVADAASCSMSPSLSVMSTADSYATGPFARHVGHPGRAHARSGRRSNGTLERRGFDVPSSDPLAQLDEAHAERHGEDRRGPAILCVAQGEDRSRLRIQAVSTRAVQVARILATTSRVDGTHRRLCVASSPAATPSVAQSAAQAFQEPQCDRSAQASQGRARSCCVASSPAALASAASGTR